MSNQVAKHRDLLGRRLALVADVSALNAEALKLTQSIAGLEMEVLRCELEIARNGESVELVRDLHEASSNAEATAAARSDCEERIAAVEEEVREVDRMLAAIGGN